MSLSRQIAIGLTAGAALGLFLGELAAPLQLVADAYVRLLQMTVLPYVTFSLIAGFGGLAPEQAKRLLTRVGALLLVIWALAASLALLMPVAFPDWESASFFSTTAPHTREGLDFLGLYIPSNPFHALANNVVPAVVLFSVLTGLGLIGVADKQPLLGVLHTAAAALGRVNQYLTRLAPIGLFAIGAVFAGTLRLEDIERIEVYLVAYTTVALLLLFWILPGLVVALTPVRYREVMGPARDAILTAGLTGSLFVVLPALGECAREVWRRHGSPEPGADDLPDVIVASAYNFPHAAKVLSLSFIPFAAWFSESSLGAADYPTLAGVGLLSFFGSLNAAIPYLLDLFRIPQDTFQLFLATGVINGRVGSAVAAVHTLALAILGSFAVAGRLSLDAGRLLRYAAVTVLATAAALFGLRLLFARGLEHQYDRDQVLARMHRIRSGVAAVVHRRRVLPPDEDAAGSHLERIRSRGRIRVGYQTDNPPYSFFNASGDLVGLDVEMAHQLAREAGLGLEFVPLEFETIEADLTSGYCDVHMSGFVVTAERATRLALSKPYLEENVSFLVSDHRRDDFATRESIRALGAVRIGVIPLASVADKVREYAPGAEMRVVDRATGLAFLEGRPVPIDALVMTAQRGAAWTLRHPQLTVVVPDPPILTLPLAYPVAGGDRGTANFLDAWVEIKKRDGTLQALYDYWVLGRNAEPHRPRWSVIRDVLGWVR